VPLSLIIIVGLLIALWVLMIRPQRRRQMEQQQLLSKIEVGDEVLTAGGVYGTVTAVEDDEVKLEIAPGLTIRLAKRAVAAIVPPEEDEHEDEPVPEEEEEAASPLP
jgi:preprotein translocase subunit YajC